MTTQNDGGPAFPRHPEAIDFANKDYDLNGMSLRDWYIGKLLPICLSEAIKEYGWGYWKRVFEEAAGLACQQADAALKARERIPEATPRAAQFTKEEIELMLESHRLPLKMNKITEPDKQE